MHEYVEKTARSLSIKAKLGLILGLLGVLVVAVGIAGLIGMSRSNHASEDIYNNQMQGAISVGDMEMGITRTRLGLLVAAVDPGSPDAEAALKRAANFSNQSDAAWARYSSLPADEEAHQLAQRVSKQRQVVQASLQVLAKAVASKDPAVIATATIATTAPYGPLIEVSDRLKSLQSSVAERSYKANQATYQTLQWLTIGLILAGLVITFFSWRSLLGAISRPLDEAVGHLDAIAAGELRNPIKIRTRDEMGRLLSALTRTQASLRETVGSVRSGSQTIAVASRQIAAGNVDLSSRTEQQAASLEETAASMEQLTGTVKQNADNARQAAGLAANAAEIAVQGGNVVGRVVSTMNEINDSSSKISEIIGLIEGIAFQTNILALNAAVEAARAGEQGRGFAVVAAEVRSLAQRSSSAAKEIKDLIGASVSRVRIGSDLVHEAGRTMSEMTAAVQRVTDIMGEISAASNEQSTGIDQVAKAVSQMDQVTQHNAALVEESAAAAQSLEVQAEALLNAVSVFKTDAAAPAGSAWSPVNSANALSSATEKRPTAPLKRPAIAVRSAAAAKSGAGTTKSLADDVSRQKNAMPGSRPAAGHSAPKSHTAPVLASIPVDDSADWSNF